MHGVGNDGTKVILFSLTGKGILYFLQNLTIWDAKGRQSNPQLGSFQDQPYFDSV